MIVLVSALVGFFLWPVWQASARSAAATPPRRRLGKIAAWMAGRLAVSLAVNAFVRGGLDADDLASAAVVFGTTFAFAALGP